MNYRVAFHTDVGIQKTTNQDSCCIKIANTDKGVVLLAVICDGMGGLSKGEVASASLIDAFSVWFEQELPYILAAEDILKTIEYSWDRMIKEKNQAIAAYGRNLHIQLGSTITSIIILEDGRYCIAHVGDTRIYKITENNLSIITEDQTVVANEIKIGRLSIEEAETDPRRNVLLQCVGASRVVIPSYYYGIACIGECFMLCSDGFRHMISNEEIYNLFNPRNNTDEVAMKNNIIKLIELNKYRNENDNITAMLIQCV